MSTSIPTPGQSPSPNSPPAATAKPQRILACVLCQQRKIKCSRKFPCSNCVKSSVQCVPAAVATRQRRRRFPERDLLKRLRHYEGLLRQNSIKFEPLHGSVGDTASLVEDGESLECLPDEDIQGPARAAGKPSREETVNQTETVYRVKNYWHAMNPKSRGPEDEDGHGNDILDGGSTPDGHFPRNEVLEDMVRKSFSHVYEHNDHLVFGSSKTDVDISALHPEQVHIFRFWQVYLENVDPLLKITHTLTLQARIINAVGNMRKISPTLEALMFSIYCISVLSLTDDECVATFATPREDLLKNYRFGCQQALFNCKFLRSRDQDCLTALYLYLLSVKSDTAPQSLSPMLGAAIRIAQRMGLHNESSYARCTPFEAEMRRRLWWALVVFDHRMCEMSDHQASMLIPTWDCKTPLNVNDSDLRPDMKHAPTSYPTATESLYAVVCSELADHLRHCDFHLDFSNPSLKTVARALRGDSQSENDSLSALGKRIEEKYLRFCNPEIPLHFMTTWWARGVLAKNQLIGYWSRFANSSMPQDSLRDNAVDHALRWIECDTQLKTSSLTQGFLWLIHFYFPFPSAVYVVQELRRRPAQIHGKRIWEVLDANYEARFKDTNRADNLFTKIFAGPLFAAWAAYEAEITQDQEPPTVPLIVMDVKRKIAQARADAQEKGIDHLDGTHGTSTGEFLTPISVDFGAYGFPYNMGGFGHDQQTLEQNSLNFNMNYFDWGAIKWNPLHLSGW